MPLPNLKFKFSKLNILAKINKKIKQFNLNTINTTVVTSFNKKEEMVVGCSLLLLVWWFLIKYQTKAKFRIFTNMYLVLIWVL
jgi:hypothetical protein